MFGIGGSNQWDLNYNETYWLGSGSAFKEVQSLALKSQPEAALEKASELDFFTGGTCMNTKQINQTHFDYIQNIKIIEDAVALDQSLRAEDAPLESFLVDIQPIDIPAEKAKLMAKQSDSSITNP